MSKVVTKADLVDCIRHHEPVLSGTLAKQLTDAFFEEIIEALEKGDDVKLSGIGIFRIRNKKARPGRNLKTGVNVMISPRNVVLFQASHKLKATLKNKPA